VKLYTKPLWMGMGGTVRRMLEDGANVDAKDDYGYTALHHAASHNQMDVAGQLLDKGAAIDAKDKSGRTPLYLAARAGHDVFVQMLVEKGASINMEDEYGWSPLLSAAATGQDGGDNRAHKVGIQTTTPSPKSTGGRSARMRAKHNVRQA
jgi:ankyrin repeat protein